MECATTTRPDRPCGPPRWRAWFASGVVVALTAATWWGTFHPDGGLWGLAGFARLPLAALILATVVVVVVLFDRGASVLGRLFLATPLPTTGPAPVGLAILSIPVFFFLRSWDLSGDWRPVLERLCLDHYYPSNLWTNYLFRITQALTQPFGLLPDECIALSSALAGGVFVYFLLRLSRLLAHDPVHARFVFWFTFFTGTTLIFFGHLEVYAPLVACTVAFLETVVLFRKGRLHPALPGLVLGVAFCFHGLAALLFPSFLYVVARWSPPRLWKRRVFLAGLAFAIPVLLSGAALWIVHWGLVPPDDPSRKFGTFLGAAGQGLLTPLHRSAATAQYHYVLEETRHWIDRINVLFRLAPVALLLAIPRFRGRGRSRYPDDPDRAAIHDYLRLTTAILLVWMFLHNVSFSARLDWDLFALVGLFLALLAAGTPSTYGPSGAGRWLTLALFTAVPWWISATSPPPDRLAATHFRLARTYQRIDRPAVEPAFLHHLIQAASVSSPPHRTALAMVTVYHASRGLPRAQVWLERAARAYPDDAEFRANLGLWYHLKKNYAGALEHLSAAVKLAPDQAAFHRDLGRLLTDFRRLPEAYAHWQRAAELRPDDPDIVLEAVDAAWRVNRKPEGLRMLEQLVKRNPDDPRVLRELIKAHREFGDGDRAQSYQQALESLLRRRSEKTPQGQSRPR